MIEDFEGESKEIMAYILDYWKNPRYNGALPTESMIRRKYPRYVYEAHKEPIEWATDKLKERSSYNFMRGMEDKIAKALKSYDLEKAGQLFTKANFEISRRAGSSKVTDLTRNMKERQFRYEQRKKGVNLYGIPTGFKWLTELTLGWQPADFIVLLGKRGVGKTWFSLIAAHAAQIAGVPVLFVSKEMDNQRLEQRYDALHSKLPYQAFRRGQLGTHLEKHYYEELKKMGDYAPFFLPEFEGKCSPETIFAKAEELQCGMIVVDGIYMLDDDHGLKIGWERYANISGDIKKHLKRTRKVLLATNQLNREEDPKNATLDNSAYSDAFGQYADVAAKAMQDSDSRVNKEMLLQLLKMREEDMPPHPRRLSWDFDRMEFEEFPEEVKSEVAMEVRVGY